MLFNLFSSELNIKSIPLETVQQILTIVGVIIAAVIAIAKFVANVYADVAQSEIAESLLSRKERKQMCQKVAAMMGLLAFVIFFILGFGVMKFFCGVPVINNFSISQTAYDKEDSDKNTQEENSKLYIRDLEIVDGPRWLEDTQKEDCLKKVFSDNYFSNIILWSFAGGLICGSIFVAIKMVKGKLNGKFFLVMIPLAFSFATVGIDMLLLSIMLATNSIQGFCINLVSSIFEALIIWYCSSMVLTSTEMNIAFYKKEVEENNDYLFFKQGDVLIFGDKPLFNECEKFNMCSMDEVKDKVLVKTFPQRIKSKDKEDEKMGKLEKRVHIMEQACSKYKKLIWMTMTVLATLIISLVCGWNGIGIIWRLVRIVLFAVFLFLLISVMASFSVFKRRRLICCSCIGAIVFTIMLFDFLNGFSIELVGKIAVSVESIFLLCLWVGDLISNEPKGRNKSKKIIKDNEEKNDNIKSEPKTVEEAENKLEDTRKNI